MNAKHFQKVKKLLDIGMNIQIHGENSGIFRIFESEYRKYTFKLLRRSLHLDILQRGDYLYGVQFIQPSQDMRKTSM